MQSLYHLLQNKKEGCNAMFKITWEKTSAIHEVPPETINKMAAAAFPDKTFSHYKVIAGGCANINIKIYFQNESDPKILRVYFRDKSAVYREKKLSTLLKDSVPLPILHYTGKMDDYFFAITDFIHGIPLRELMLGNESYDMQAIMHDVGLTLLKINSFKFAQSGFFDNQLKIITNSSNNNNLMAHADECLQGDNVNTVLGAKIILQIHDCLNKCRHLLPKQEESNLVHGDFDPSNIFIDRTNGRWKITGVLDWEFAFSGSSLWDIANMLRYAHKMPKEFQNAFINALVKGGMQLPTNWEDTTHLLNLLALLDCLKRANAEIQPNQCKDVYELIEYNLQRLT